MKTKEPVSKLCCGPMPAKNYNYNLVLSHLAHSVFLKDSCRTSGEAANLNTYIPRTKYKQTSFHNDISLKTLKKKEKAAQYINN